MKEIGGYIELDKTYGHEYHENAIALNSGRHCLEYLIKAKEIKKIYIPYFLCSSVREQCVKCGCKTEYYNIDKRFQPIFAKSLSADEYLYIVNYYGQLTDADIKLYKIRIKNIIVDNAQAFFQRPVECVDTLYTCRKFFGVPDGGYLYTDKYLDGSIETDKSFDRMEHILGRFENSASGYYHIYTKNEYEFQRREMLYMSKLTHNLLMGRGINYNVFLDKRTKNFKYLHNELADVNKLQLNIPDGAFMYPFYTENGTELKKKLIQNKIYVPTLWSDVFDVADRLSLEWNFAENIVPLPIDQRYDESDMKRVTEILKKYI